MWATLGIYALHHDPLVWNNPEVSRFVVLFIYHIYHQKFDPLRFTTENIKKMDPFSYLLFSAGPRYQCELLLVYIIHNTHVKKLF